MASAGAPPPGQIDSRNRLASAKVLTSAISVAMPMTIPGTMMET